MVAGTGEEIKWSDLRFMTEDGKEQLQEEAQAKRIGQGIGSAAFAMTYMGRPVAVKVCYHTVNPRESPKRLLKFFFNEIRALRYLYRTHAHLLLLVVLARLEERTTKTCEFNAGEQEAGSRERD
jgi:hypothetical protein